MKKYEKIRIIDANNPVAKKIDNGLLLFDNRVYEIRGENNKAYLLETSAEKNLAADLCLFKGTESNKNAEAFIKKSAKEQIESASYARMEIRRKGGYVVDEGNREV